MKTILCSFFLMLAPAFAQYKSYSDWMPTNEGGVEYHWVVDTESPRACTVQFRDLYKDGDSLVRASIKFRTLHSPEALVVSTLVISAPITDKSGESAQRILLSCTFLDHVNVEHTIRH